jgi:hypothetical protein
MILCHKDASREVTIVCSFRRHISKAYTLEPYHRLGSDLIRDLPIRIKPVCDALLSEDPVTSSWEVLICEAVKRPDIL